MQPESVGKDPRRTHHELLTQIAVIGLQVDLLREGKLKRGQKEIVKELGKAVIRANAMALELTEMLPAPDPAEDVLRASEQ